MSDRDHYPGEPCPEEGCHGKLGVVGTTVYTTFRLRYLQCRLCRRPKPMYQQQVPLRFAPPRAGRKS